MPEEAFRIVRLANGTCSVHAVAERETMHPGIGPLAEAEALYIQQLQLPDRITRHSGEFVVWDVGLGAAANVLALLRAVREIDSTLRIISFDQTLEPLRFALRNAELLGYFGSYEAAVAEFVKNTHVAFANGRAAVTWEFRQGDFPALLQRRLAALPEPGLLSAPDAILYDPYSPAKNPAMWTQPLFADLFRALDPSRPCALATYSRSTSSRVALLLAGFFAGAGRPSGPKEETTIAANSPDLVPAPLDRKWLERARQSTSAEPLHGPVYRQAPLSPESWEKLRRHPQFN